MEKKRKCSSPLYQQIQRQLNAKAISLISVGSAFPNFGSILSDFLLAAVWNLQ